MPNLKRFGVSVESELIKKFDKFIKSKKYSNRSEAIRDLIRENLIEEEWKENKEVVGILTLIYDHHKRELVDKLMDIQHNSHEIILSTQHIHLDHHNCLEIIVVKGKALQINNLRNIIRSQKGVKHCTLTTSTTGKEII